MMAAPSAMVSVLVVVPLIAMYEPKNVIPVPSVFCAFAVQRAVLYPAAGPSPVPVVAHPRLRSVLAMLYLLICLCSDYSR